MKIGFIGLGTLGTHMSRHVLEAGHELTVYDIRPEAVEVLTRLGAAPAANPRAVAGSVETVITSLPGPPQVEQVFFGPDGVLAGARPGMTLIDMSTSDPDQTRRIIEAAASRGVEVLDAPVTLGAERAATASLTIFVGGKKDVVDRHMPVLRAIGNTVLHVGPAGTAQTVKLITNQVFFVNAIALGEGLVTGVKAGIPLMTLWNAINSSAGGSWMCENYASFIFSGDYHRTFTMDLCCKDLTLIGDLARAQDVPVPMTALAEQIYRHARHVYGGNEGELSPIRMLEDATGVSLRAPQAQRTGD